MNKEMIYVMIQLVIMLISYLIGKYIFPKLSEDDLKNFELVKGWVEQFVNEAANFVNYTGEEKKKYVTEQISLILAEKGIEMTEKQISALIETAYNAFIKAVEDNNEIKAEIQELKICLLKGV